MEKRNLAPGPYSPAILFAFFYLTKKLQGNFFIWYYEQTCVNLSQDLSSPAGLFFVLLIDASRGSPTFIFVSRISSIVMAHSLERSNILPMHVVMYVPSLQTHPNVQLTKGVIPCWDYFPFQTSLSQGSKLKSPSVSQPRSGSPKGNWSL